MDWEQAALFIFIVNVIVVFGGMIALWVLNLQVQNLKWVEIGWNLLLFWSGVTAFLFGNGLQERLLMMLSLVGFWSLRQITRMKPRDLGTNEMKVLGMFLTQGVWILLLSLPLISISLNPAPLNLLDFIGFTVALAGLIREPRLFWIGIALFSLEAPFGFTGLFACAALFLLPFFVPPRYRYA